MALPPLVGQRHHGPPISLVLCPGTQHGPTAFGVSRTDAGRNVLWQRRRGSRRPDGACGRRAAGPHRGQPIGGMRKVPVHRRGCMITDRRPLTRGLERLERMHGTSRVPGRLSRADDTVFGRSAAFRRGSALPHMTRTRARNCRMSAKIAARILFPNVPKLPDGPSPPIRQVVIVVWLRVGGAARI